MQTYGERVKWARQHAGLTQRDLGDKIGISQQGIANIEASKARTGKYVLEIACATGVSPQWLETANGERFPRPIISVGEAESVYSVLPQEKRTLLETYDSMPRHLQKKFQKIGEALAYGEQRK